jgi:tetratricopeptide (TPR) repeat protein
VHYARLHRALATLDQKSDAEKETLCAHLRTGPASIGKVLAKGPLNAILGTLDQLVPSDDPANVPIWGAVLDHLPDNAPADLRYDLAADVRAMGDAARALPHLETYVDEYADDEAEAWLELGDARVATGDAQGALDAWEKAGTLDDTLGAAWSRRGMLYAQIGMPDAAVAVLSEAVVREDDPDTWLLLGRCLIAVGLDEDAKSPLERAVAGYGDDHPEALYARGAAKALAGDADGAFNDLLSAGTEAPELLAEAVADADYLRLSEHPRWASIAG